MLEFPSPPAKATAMLLLKDGSIFFGRGIGALGATVGELCFNTGLTGYQEILTDPSYAGQIITFTFPHIGNVGANGEDYETLTPAASGLVVREYPTAPSNFRTDLSLNEWLAKHGVIGISGVDTRALTRKLRIDGHQNAIIAHFEVGQAPDISALFTRLQEAPSMKGRELAKDVTCASTHVWQQGRWDLGSGYDAPESFKHSVVAVDFGAKHTILRCLVEAGCKVTVVPATATAEEIFAHKPEGIFLSNGPGDPAATGVYALPMIKKLIETGLPIFGICLGHQLLGLALGCQTEKMPLGHRGCNHPVKDLQSGRVMITSQNHGFMVSEKNLPADIEVTHISLFDKTVQGIRHKSKPIFSVQGHPEASPGPHDSYYLFEKFVEMMAGVKSV